MNEAPPDTSPAGGDAGPGDIRDRRIWFIRTAARLTGTVVVIVAAYFWTPTSFVDAGEVIARLVITVSLIGIAAAAAVRSVMKSASPLVRAGEVMVALVAFLLTGFAFVYLMASTEDPAAFSEPLNHVGALYFSLTTATTVGFGDITPKSDLARAMVMVQMVTNVVILGAVTRLVMRVVRRRTSGTNDAH